MPFVCPSCEKEVNTADSRQQQSGGRRRRDLCPCGYKFTTLEVVMSKRGNRLTSMNHLHVLDIKDRISEINELLRKISPV